MKIAHVVTRMDELGGAQVHVRDLSLWLKNHGHDCVVLAGDPGVVSRDLQDKGIAFHEIPDMHRSIHPVKDIKAVLQLRKKLKEIKPDLVTCHSSKAGLIGRLAAKSLGLPVIFTAHNWTFGKGVSIIQRPVYWALEWFAGHISNHIITVSEFGRHQALAAFIASPKKITAINNGIVSKPRNATKNTNSSPRMIMVARVGWPKDHERLLRVLHDHCSNLDWSLDLVGGGDLGFLNDKVKQYQLGNRVRVLGERRDVEQLLEESDIFVLATDWEGFPLSILEAMAKDLPVLASDVGGISESVIHGKNGLLVEAGNDDDLAKALKTLIPDASGRKEMGEQGRRLFEEKFRFDHMASRTLDLYIKVLAQ